MGTWWYEVATPTISMITMNTEVLQVHATRTCRTSRLFARRIIPLGPNEVPVRVAVGLLPAAHFHDLVNRVGEGGLESDGTAPWSPRVAHE